MNRDIHLVHTLQPALFSNQEGRDFTPARAKDGQNEEGDGLANILPKIFSVVASRDRAETSGPESLVQGLSSVLAGKDERPREETSKVHFG